MSERAPVVSRGVPRARGPGRGRAHTSLLVALAAGACLTGCGSTSVAAAPHGSGAESEPALADYVFVFLDTGTPDLPPTPDELNEIRAGHFANMARLAEEGVLVLAGPLGQSEDGVARQGVFVFDVDGLDEAAWYAGSDPAVQSGLLRFDARPWRATTRLRTLLAVDLAAEAAAQAATGAPSAPGANARSYVLVTTDDAAAAEPALADLVASGAVLLYGCFGGEHAGGALFALDANTFEQARALLPPGPPWTLHAWYATNTLARLPELSE